MSPTGVTHKPNATVAPSAKEKKPKVPKEKKTKSVFHPPYFQMIKEALLAMNEKGGSSPHAIGKYMEEKHRAVLPENFRKMLGLQLKNCVAKGKLKKVKASYKLSEDGKKVKAPVAGAGKKRVAKKTKSEKTATRATATATVTATVTAGVRKNVKKSVSSPAGKKVRKMTPAKAKQPKSIKSPAAKRARKATA
ncbi:hypothetical protein QVD17_05007 [Tagetes erecta]|uniref:H15 domain-containing protein n=1 Tax=Tagetes erecta TaxID=13708 RepID=A0AAD8LHD5_TARER|nr:hypothetical protein QVD17_05007 [Tagetes erecta]